MAFVVNKICESRESGFSVQGQSGGGTNTVTHTAQQTFTVYTSALTPADVTDVEIGCLPQLPTVNRTTWYSATTGTSLPFAVCRSKTVKRMTDNAFVFEVTCNYTTGAVESEQCAAVPPTNLSDIVPEVSASVGVYDRTVYTDKTFPGPKQCWSFVGTDTPFATPVMEKIPTLTIVVTQFESSITFEQMLERSYKLNKSTYRSKGKGLWMIGAVQAVEQDVQLAGGPTSAVKVTYPIMLSERFFYPPGSNVKTIYGHDTTIPLVDTVYLDGNDIKPFEKGGSVVSGYINTDGTERVPANDEEKRPDYLRFKTLEDIEFSTFLQV